MWRGKNSVYQYRSLLSLDFLPPPILILLLQVPTPFDKEPQQRTSQVTSESLPSLVSSEVYRAQNHLPSSSSTSYSVNMLLDQILSDLHSHMY